MSSRAAAGRKRLAPGPEPTRQSSSKSFFFRSKPTAVPPPQLEPTAPSQYPAAQPSTVASFIANRELHGSGPNRMQETRPDLFNADRSRGHQYGHSPSPTPKKVTSGPVLVSAPPSPYPSPTQRDLIQRNAVNFNTGSARGNGFNGYHEDTGITYIEASYQPPPPLQASYQPPPPVLRNSSNGQRSLPSLPEKRGSSASDASTAFTSPPNYVPPTTPPPNAQYSLPSPSPSPRQAPVLLQRISPTPTEPPTYSSSGYENYSSTQFDRPPLQISIHNSPLSPHARQEYVDYSQTSSYPSPPSSQHPRLTPSPLHTSTSPNQSATSLPIENDARRPWYRGTRGNQSSTPPSPLPVAIGFQLSPAPSIIESQPRRNRPPESISGSSDSSAGSRSPFGETPTPVSAAPAFVYPGSRSIARPKVRDKTNSPVIKIKVRGKSRKRNGSDATPAAALPPAPTPNPDASYFDPPPSAGSTGSDEYIYVNEPSRSPVVGSPDHPESRPDNVPAFSNESDLGVANTRGAQAKSNAGSSKSGGSGPTTSPKPMIFPAGRSRAQPSKVPPGIKLKSFTPRLRTTSSTSSGGEHEERPRFMGIPLKRKKKPKAPESINGSTMISSESSDIGNSLSQSLPSSSDTGYSHDESQEAIHTESSEKAKRIKSRVGSYPLDPYDSVLLDNDRQTGELLMRLNPTGSPSFHNYGNTPPMSVLDLGCGQGHWVVDAAIAWKGYGTRVTGYDMVDITKGLLPWAVERGVVDNVRFVRGNFLKQRLPFSDNMFDLVRMSCLALCITSDSWDFVLQEVCRVLEVGGRLELIDDLIFFPYGTFSTALGHSRPTKIESVAPKLDITIPSSSFSTFSIYDGQTTNPGLGASIMEEEEPDDFFDLYGVEEEETDLDDTATLNGREAQSMPDFAPGSRSTPQPTRNVGPVISSRSWNRALATSGDLEALFEHMLTHKFGIRKDPSDFVLDLMKGVFGYAREVKTMNLTLAPPEPADVDVLMSPRSVTPRPSPQIRRDSMGLSQSPGLVLWPSTFLPMEQSEIEIHASKHLRILLSCKKFLLEHAVEATDDEEIDEDSVLEALWEYEGFLRHRFNPPPPSPNKSFSGDGSDHLSDNSSIRGSIAESVSSDGRESMWEIQSEFRQCFAWRRSPSADSLTTPITPNTPKSTEFSASSHNPVSTTRPTINDHHHDSLNPAPIYSRDELTHVRTFRIYEAIKFDESMFGLAT